MLWCVALLLFQQRLLDLPNVSQNPYTTAADIDLGKKLYGGRCCGMSQVQPATAERKPSAVALLPRGPERPCYVSHHPVQFTDTEDPLTT